MSLDLFLAEADKLKRKCFFLHSEGTGNPVAFWGGERGDFRGRFNPRRTVFSESRHLFTLHPDLVSDLELSYFSPPQPISLFELRENTGGISHRVPLIGNAPTFEDLELTGEPLFAETGISYPPFPAVCLHGSDRIAQFLQSHGLRRHQYFLARYVDPSLEVLEEKYAQETKATLAFAREYDLQVGGWAFDWWDRDYYLPAEMTHIATTFRDAEPWHELVQAQATGGFRVKSHVT